MCATGSFAHSLQYFQQEIWVTLNNTMLRHGFVLYGFIPFFLIPIYLEFIIRQHISLVYSYI
jgi:hypothetical protein